VVSAVVPPGLLLLLLGVAGLRPPGDPAPEVGVAGRRRAELRGVSGTFRSSSSSSSSRPEKINKTIKYG
jgi:hypothetical protein